MNGLSWPKLGVLLTLLPRSPIWYVTPETLTVPKTEAPPTGVTRYLPPAWPHGSLRRMGLGRQADGRAVHLGRKLGS